MIFDTLTISAMVLTVVLSAFLLSSRNHPRYKGCEAKDDNLDN
ncbi:MAG: hypothetical protein ABW168_01200 [Sedimenticola sp.]